MKLIKTWIGGFKSLVTKISCIIIWITLTLATCKNVSSYSSIFFQSVRKWYVQSFFFFNQKSGRRPENGLKSKMINAIEKEKELGRKKIHYWPRLWKLCIRFINLHKFLLKVTSHDAQALTFNYLRGVQLKVPQMGILKIG